VIVTSEKPDKLVSTGVAAKAVGVSRQTLSRWAQEGLVTPRLITAGGQARWSIDDLMTELRALRERDD
jgi:DNA-binding transcriptional MerR regulator